MKKMNRKGFTIVELVIVIAVIAILAGVLIPTFSGIVDRAKESAILQQARNKYTEFVGMHDYTTGDPAQNLVIEVGKGNNAKDLKFVIVVGGQMNDKIYDTEDDAREAAKYTNVAAGASNAAYFLCDEHDWKSDATPVAAPECEDCDAKCDKKTTDVTESTCPVCGLAPEKHPAGTNP